MEKVVLSLGGSLIVPDKIDSRYISTFRDFILRNIAKTVFYVTVGGGRTARDYIAAANFVRETDPKDLDWIGIHATRLNAQLLKTALGDFAQPIVINDPSENVDSRYKVFVAAGYRPGNSTDCIAVRLAKHHQVNTVINMTNTDYAYDKDPKRFEDAKAIEKISWADFRKIVGNKWVPGLSAPFDPIASREAEEGSMKVVIANGHNLANIEDILSGRNYIGTTISG